MSAWLYPGHPWTIVGLVPPRLIPGSVVAKETNVHAVVEVCLDPADPDAYRCTSPDRRVDGALRGEAYGIWAGRVSTQWD